MNLSPIAQVQLYTPDDRKNDVINYERNAYSFDITGSGGFDISDYLLPQRPTYSVHGPLGQFLGYVDTITFDWKIFHRAFLKLIKI